MTLEHSTHEVPDPSTVTCKRCGIPVLRDEGIFKWKRYYDAVAYYYYCPPCDDAIWEATARSGFGERAPEN